MTVANYCMIVAALLPVLCAALAKSGGYGKRRRDGGFDNHDPRSWLSRQTGWQARANAAQANGFEALPLFSPVCWRRSRCIWTRGVSTCWPWCSLHCG